MGPHQNSQSHVLDYLMNKSYNTITKTIFDEPLQLPILVPLVLLMAFLTLFVAFEQIQWLRERANELPEASQGRERSSTPQTPKVIPAHARSATPRGPEVIPALARSVSVTPNPIGSDYGIPLNNRQGRQQNQHPVVKIEASENLIQRDKQPKKKDSQITIHRRFSRQQCRAPGVLLDCHAYNNPDAQVTVRNVPTEHVGWDLNVEVNGADLDMVAEDDKRFYLFYKKQFDN